MKKINVWGVELADYPLKESLALIDGYFGSAVLNTVLYVTTPMLRWAGNDEEGKRCIEAVDVTLCGDTEILKAAGIESVSRIYEIEHLVFLKEFMRRLAHRKKKAYLLAGSEEELDILEKELRAFRPDILVGGTGILAEETQNIEETINRINDVVPDAIISRLPFGQQERVMADARPFVNAKVWLGLSKDMAIGSDREMFRKRIVKFCRKIFYRQASLFRNRNKKEE